MATVKVSFWIFQNFPNFEEKSREINYVFICLCIPVLPQIFLIDHGKGSETLYLPVYPLFGGP